MLTASFTSAAGNPGAIAICRGIPAHFTGPAYDPLRPPRAMLRLSRADFTTAYSALLSTLDPATVWRELNALVAPAEPVLLCYEPHGFNCHRRQVAEWLELHLGIEICELGHLRSATRPASASPSKPASTHWRRKSQPNHPSSEPTLFPEDSGPNTPPPGARKDGSMSIRKKTRTQRGSIVKIGSNWFVRFWETKNLSGTLIKRRASHKLGPVTTRGKHPPPDIVNEARLFMAKLATSTLPAEKAVTLEHFVETVYLPHVDEHTRPSTAKNYYSIWKLHLKPHCGGTWMQDVQTFTIQNWLNAIAKSATVPMSRNSLKRIQSALSGIFKHARRLGFFEGANPVKDTCIDPTAAEPEAMHAYSLEEERAFLDVLPEPAATAFATACYTGLRLGELSGLQWEDLRDGELHVSRAIWNGHVGKPKTAKSAAAIPIIKPLSERLALHRVREGNPETGPIFRNSLGRPLSLSNVLHRDILPTLRRCLICGRSKGIPHLPADHDWQRDPRLPEWRGWHACRRGLGSNLYRLGVPPLVIQRILRHSNVSTTQAYYILPVGDDVRKAMTSFENAIPATLPGRIGHLSDTKTDSGAPPESIN